MGAVQAALAQLKEAGLLVGQQGSGVYVARSIETKRSTHQAPWVALLMNVQGHVYGRLCEQMAGHLEDHSFRTVKVGADRTRRNDAQWIDALLAGWAEDPPAAVVFQQGGERLRTAIERRFVGRSRLIAAVRQVPSADRAKWHSVDTDEHRLAELAVSHLLSQGHRRIGYLTHPRNIDREVGVEHPKRAVGHTRYILALGRALRRRGLQHALTVHYRAREVPHQPDGEEANPFIEANLRSLRAWFQKENRPTAVFGTDVRVAAAMRAARDIGLTPGVDIVGLGVGDTPWAQALGFQSVSLCEDLIAQRIADLVTAPAEQVDQTSFHLSVPPAMGVNAAADAIDYL